MVPAGPFCDASPRRPAHGALLFVDLVAQLAVQLLELGAVGGVHRADAERPLNQCVGPRPVDVEKPDRLRRQEQRIGHEVGEWHVLEQPETGKTLREIARDDALAELLVLVRRCRLELDRDLERREDHLAREHLDAHTEVPPPPSRWRVAASMRSSSASRCRPSGPHAGTADLADGVGRDHLHDVRQALPQADVRGGIEAIGGRGGHRDGAERRRRTELRRELAHLAQREAEPSGDDLVDVGPDRPDSGRPGSASGRLGARTFDGALAAPTITLRPTSRPRSTTFAAERGLERTQPLQRALGQAPGPFRAELLAPPAHQRRHDRGLRQREQTADLERAGEGEIFAAVGHDRGGADRSCVRAAAGRRSPPRRASSRAA